MHSVMICCFPGISVKCSKTAKLQFKNSSPFSKLIDCLFEQQRCDMNWMFLYKDASEGLAYFYKDISYFEIWLGPDRFSIRIMLL